MDELTHSEHAGERPSVLLAFRASNVFSFRDSFELSLVARTRSGSSAARDVEWNERGDSVRVLPQAAIFGANASGKSNVLKAMSVMRELVVHSFSRLNRGERLNQPAFRLDHVSSHAPSTFEVDLILHGVRHTYGFAITDHEVVEEWLFYSPRGRTARLFERRGMQVDVGKGLGPKRESARDLLRANALLVPTAAATNHPVLGPLYDWFHRNLRIAADGNLTSRQEATAAMVERDDLRRRIVELLGAADLGIADVHVDRSQVDPTFHEHLSNALRAVNPDAEIATEQREVRLAHQAAHGTELFDLEDESLGTRTWFSIIGPLLEVLSYGGVFLLDEIDASLHPTLVREIVAMVQDKETNPHRAQMVFTTHETTLLNHEAGERLLGRDQIWFTEKGTDGVSQLYSLDDFPAREKDGWSRRYLSGRYGAVPLVEPHRMAAALRD